MKALMKGVLNAEMVLLRGAVDSSDRTGCDADSESSPNSEAQRWVSTEERLLQGSGTVDGNTMD